jgi:hypothetical protein
MLDKLNPELEFTLLTFAELVLVVAILLLVDVAELFAEVLLSLDELLVEVFSLEVLEEVLLEFSDKFKSTAFTVKGNKVNKRIIAITKKLLENFNIFNLLFFHLIYLYIITQSNKHV